MNQAMDGLTRWKRIYIFIMNIDRCIIMDFDYEVEIKNSKFSLTHLIEVMSVSNLSSESKVSDWEVIMKYIMADNWIQEHRSSFFFMYIFFS